MAEPAPEAKSEAKAEETAQVAEDRLYPAEAEVAETDQLEGHNNETCDGCHRKDFGRLKKLDHKTMRILCGPIPANLTKRGQLHRGDDPCTVHGMHNQHGLP